MFSYQALNQINGKTVLSSVGYRLTTTIWVVVVLVGGYNPYIHPTLALGPSYCWFLCWFHLSEIIYLKLKRYFRNTPPPVPHTPPPPPPCFTLSPPRYNLDYNGVVTEKTKKMQPSKQSQTFVKFFPSI
jgi:hypothetical protein